MPIYILLIFSVLAYGDAHLCPGRCHCSGTLVDCSNAELVNFPWNLPVHTTELHLQKNSLTAVPIQVLSDLPHLKVLNLANNRISVIDSDVVERTKQLEGFILYGNPLHCSCEIIPLIRSEGFLARNDTKRSTDDEAFCHSPDLLAGKPLRELKLSAMGCGRKRSRTLRSTNGTSSNDTTLDMGSGVGSASGSGEVGNGTALPTNASSALPTSASSDLSTSTSLAYPTNDTSDMSSGAGSSSGSGEVGSGTALPTNASSISALPTNASLALSPSGSSTLSTSASSALSTSASSALPTNASSALSTNASLAQGTIASTTVTPSESTDVEPTTQQWFLLEFEDASCETWKNTTSLFLHSFVNVLNNYSNSICPSCQLTTRNTTATRVCDESRANVILNVTLTLQTASLPDDVDANNFTDYYLTDYLENSSNKSSNKTIIFVFGGVAYSLRSFCGSSKTDCSIVLPATTVPPTTTVTDVSRSPPRDKDEGLAAETIAIAVICSVALLVLWIIMIVWFCRNVYSCKRETKETKKAKKYWDSMSASRPQQSGLHEKSTVPKAAKELEEAENWGWPTSPV